MKTPDKQIVSMLQAFDEKDVLKAFDLYRDGIQNSESHKSSLLEQELKDDGWIPQDEKPESAEFYQIDGKYWVQTEEARQRDRLKVAKNPKAGDPIPAPVQQKSKTDMSLRLVDIPCPVCGSKMYKQSVCPGCAEGRQGYRIRLLCEDYSDHEVLL